MSHSQCGSADEDGFRRLELSTPGGVLQTHFYEAEPAQLGLLAVGGAGGGFDTPAGDLYPRLCTDLRGDGCHGLRVRFRDPGDLLGSVADVLHGIAFLESRGARSIGLVGHSFGGAVTIQAAAAALSVRTVVALATQSYGAEAAARLGPRCSLLLIHGEADEVLPSYCSEYVYRLAGEPKELRLLAGTGHGLVESGEKVFATVRDWLRSRLSGEG